MSGAQNGGNLNSDETRRRPLLEPAFVSELERLSETARRVLLNSGGRRRAVPPTEPGRRTARKPRPVADSADTTGRPRKAVGGDRSARSGKLSSLARMFHRLFRGRHRALYLLLDATESMEMRSEETKRRKWDQARRLAAALGVASRSRYDRVFIGALGQAGGRRATRLSSDADASAPILKSLERLRPGGKGRFLAALADWARRAPADAACVVFSDFASPEWEEGVALLAESRIRHIALVQILDPGDMGKPTKSSLILHDANGKVSRELTVDAGIIAGFRETLERFCGDLAARCREAGLGYCLTHTDEPFEETLIETLTEHPASHHE